MATLSGQKAVTTAGTPVALAPSQAVNDLIQVKALSTNTGLVFVGNVNGTVSSLTGMPLAAGEAVVLKVGNLATVFVDSAVNGEGVAWLALSL